MLTFEFQVNKDSRQKYKFDSSLFSVTGDLIAADFKQARLLSGQINEVRKAEGNKFQLVTPGHLNALCLLHEIFHYIIRMYEETINPGVFSRGVSYLAAQLGDDLQNTLLEYINHYPPLEVYKGNITPEEFLKGSMDNKPNTEIILEEIILLNLQNNNPASVLFEELYTDKQLAEKTKYLELVDHTHQFFVNEKPVGKGNLPLTNFLKDPLLASPYSIDGQLKYIEEQWGVYVYTKFHDRLLGGLDLIYEDTKLFISHGGGGEKASPPVPQYKYDKAFMDEIHRKIRAGEQLTDEESRFYYAEPEHFTADTDWMPNVVMIAKNSFVWLFQLSQKYNRSITRLDQIPDEELDTLAAQNFNALWLIGVWERSSASKKIKQLMGNPEAASSAYSLYDYVISGELGGEEAYEKLKNLAWQRGIRLASDMVPNHTGIHSKWVIEKPDYFLQTKHPPYPGYTFNGPNLSEDGRVEVRIEDHYYNMSDAAVVFQRRDSHTGDVRYIYHGNDGTHMPWNDTAQLDLLNPEVRESLIQTIMHVARKFPIIRFDAAMTLAKKHYQRLWFPQPGTAGAVPSRVDFGMSREQFDNAMPVEFWREVVDRINSELPNTLLLAEAFWLMESYFVRSLGMHRVYNSAFMHMMMKEENSKYKDLIKNTLDFNPEILKRYVNFMSNPDEETAVNQFGKGDKYFGVTMLMVTLPGLPMFAHGQIEGFAEKYGMEYQRSYYNEFTDDNLVNRHRTEIFPLMQKRYLFSQSQYFELYDFIDNHGNINDNVFVYSNGTDRERALIIYNNSYEEAWGTFNYAVRKSGGNGSSRLAGALNLKNEHRYFYVYRDSCSNQEYLIRGTDVHDQGMYFYVRGYQYFVLLGFKEYFDFNGDMERLFNYLNGRGVPSVEQALHEMNLIPLHSAFSDLYSPEMMSEYNTAFYDKPNQIILDVFRKDFKNHLNTVAELVNHQWEVPVDKKRLLNNMDADLEALAEVNRLIESGKGKPVNKGKEWISSLTISGNGRGSFSKDLLLPVLMFRNLLDGKSHSYAAGFYDTLLPGSIFPEIFKQLGHSGREVNNGIKLMKILSIFDGGSSKPAVPAKKGSRKQIQHNISGEEYLITELFEIPAARDYLGINEYQGITYFSKERFEELTDWLFTLDVLRGYRPQPKSKTAESKKVSADKSETAKRKNIPPAVNEAFNLNTKLKTVSAESGYRLSVMKQMLAVPAPSKKKLDSAGRSADKTGSKPAGGTAKKVVKKAAKAVNAAAKPVAGAVSDIAKTASDAAGDIASARDVNDAAKKAGKAMLDIAKKAADAAGEAAKKAAGAAADEKAESPEAAAETQKKQKSAGAKSVKSKKSTLNPDTAKKSTRRRKNEE